jgi:hypothetical protein
MPLEGPSARLFLLGIYILCVENVGGLLCNIMNALEDGIDFWIVAMAFPPPFDNSFIITIDLDLL